jgi:hypothetical protein
METDRRGGVYFTKESIYLLKILRTFTLTLRSAPVGSNESLGKNIPRNMTCVRLAVFSGSYNGSYMLWMGNREMDRGNFWQVTLYTSSSVYSIN